MGLMSALNAAVSGLRTTQASMNLVSQNVANAHSVGYTRRISQPVQQTAGDRTAGVRSGEVERVLDLLVQKQLRLERAGASYTSFMARLSGQVDRLFGTPGEAGALDTVLNTFTQSLQTLLSDPGSVSARSGVLDQAGILAGQIARVSEGVQALRTEAEGRIGLGVARANELLTGIAEVNARIVANQSPSDPALLDDRDRMIDELSTLMDVHVAEQPTGGVTITTTAGLALFNGYTPVRLAFDGRANLAPQSLYSADPAARTVGTILAVGANGVATDLIANQMIRSGELAAAVEMRDETLVRAQRQLDELAAGLARALSDRPVGTGPSGGGFAGDFSGLQPGNTIALTVDHNGTLRTITLVGMNGTAAPAIAPGDVGDPGAIVVPFDATGGMGAVQASIQARLSAAGIAVAVTNPAGGSLHFVGTGTTAVTGLSGAVTATGLAEGAPELPLFVDGGNRNAPYAGTFDNGAQLTGLAQRLAVNPQLLADRQRLVVYGAGVPQGDTLRPQFMLDALTKTARDFAPAAGLNGAAPFSASVTDFARRVVEAQGANAESAARLDEGQGVALAAVESRYREDTGVNIDQEMAQLVQLQTAYGANARVMTAVRDMMDMLMRM
ncbi:MAG TPA: flagellar hook-associated protein FlgK [Microvirga sp.]|nr:flagellar hook-associated protein FlgK [Microvirga sp.]